MPQNLETALRYAAKGLHVFPLRGKIPAISKEDGGSGFKDATTSPEQIKAWWTADPTLNIGIATGASNLYVVDVDAKDGGLASYEELCQFIPDIVKGWSVKTGGGGIHVYFKYDYADPLKNTQSDLAPGIDTRGIDGYVAAPPSLHESGNRYTWTQHEGDMPVLPEALKNRLTSLQNEPKQLGNLTDDTGEKLTDGRKRFLASAAGRFRRIGADAETILAALQTLNQRRCQPPLGDDIVLRTANSIARYQPAENLMQVAEQKFDQARKGRKKLRLVSYSQIKKEDIDWLWYGRIAYGKFTLAVGMPGKGKCLAPGTAIIMADGTLRNVEDIRTGQKVMGPDGSPRKVLGTTTGTGPMYRVTDMASGEFYDVNEHHILPIYWHGKHYLKTAPWVAKSSGNGTNICGYRTTGIEFPDAKLMLEPYYLGLWLGDGTSTSSAVTNEDKEVEDYLRGYADRLGLGYRQAPNTTSACPTHFITNVQGKKDSLQAKLRELSVLSPSWRDNRKAIPKAMFTASRRQRLELLAGLVDSDGHLTFGGYEITTKYPRLADGIVRLGRSLGFRVSDNIKRIQYKGETKEYRRLRIAGDIDQVPVLIPRKKAQPRLQKKQANRHTIKVEPIGEGQYAGFELDGDHLFLLGDYTVTHNSYLTCALAAAVTTGTALPDDPFALRCTPKDVLLLTYEDGQGDTIRPRLERCGADLDRVHTIAHDEEQFTVKDVESLEEALDANPSIKLVVIDPVQSIMVGSDGNNDESVRQALNPLVRAAMQRNIAILGIKHLNKNENASIENRIGGSIGYAGLARSVLLVGHDNRKPFESGITYGGIVATKTNVASATMPIAYQITSNGFEWLGPDPEMTVESLLPAKQKKERD